MTSHTGSSFPRFFLGVFLSLIAFVVLYGLFQLFFGIMYDTEHFADTYFILGAAWRVVEGLQPVVDFGHFYGGFVSETLGWTMKLFGPHASVFYLFNLILGGFLIACAFLFMREHHSPLGVASVALVTLTLMMTRYPIETNDPIIRVFSTHSFFYNRYAQNAMLVVALFIFFRGSRTRVELISGAVAGFLVGSVCLTKPTFVVVLPGLFLALLIARRWYGAGGALLGLGAFILAFDPTLQRFFGSLDYALAHVGGSNSIAGLIRKSVQIPMYQPVAFCAALVAVILCFKHRAARLPVLSAVVLSGTVVGMTATMGGNGSIGQLALPTFIAICVGCAELARTHSNENEPVIRYISVALVLGFVLPHIANMAGSAAEGFAHRSDRLIEQGPYDRYLSNPEQRADSPLTDQYEMLADGMTAVRSLGDPSQWGIIADSGITFEHALLAKPVPGYPLWQRSTAPEFAADRELSEDVDIVLLARETDAEIAPILRAKMKDMFTVCAVSQHWDIYAHQKLGLTTCSAGE